MTIAEGYGMTESSPVITVSEEGNNGLRFGSVGKPIDGVETRLQKMENSM